MVIDSNWSNQAAHNKKEDNKGKYKNSESITKNLKERRESKEMKNSPRYSLIWNKRIRKESDKQCEYTENESPPEASYEIPPETFPPCSV